MTLSLLGVISELHLYVLDTPVPIIIVVVLALASIGWAYITNRNENVRHLLTQGWWPLFAAMAISSGTGIVLDTFVERYSGFALLAIAIAGAYIHNPLAVYDPHPLLDIRSAWRCQLDLRVTPLHCAARSLSQDDHRGRFYDRSQGRQAPSQATARLDDSSRC